MSGLLLAMPGLRALLSGCTTPAYAHGSHLTARGRLEAARVRVASSKVASSSRHGGCTPTSRAKLWPTPSDDLVTFLKYAGWICPGHVVEVV